MYQSQKYDVWSTPDVGRDKDVLGWVKMGQTSDIIRRYDTMIPFLLAAKARAMMLLGPYLSHKQALVHFAWLLGL